MIHRFHVRYIEFKNETPSQIKGQKVSTKGKDNSLWYNIYDINDINI